MVSKDRIPFAKRKGKPEIFNLDNKGLEWMASFHVVKIKNKVIFKLNAGNLIKFNSIIFYVFI